jgi:hypothetical protein
MYTVSSSVVVEFVEELSEEELAAVESPLLESLEVVPPPQAARPNSIDRERSSAKNFFMFSSPFFFYVPCIFEE